MVTIFFEFFSSYYDFFILILLLKRIEISLYLCIMWEGTNYGRRGFVFLFFVFILMGFTCFSHCWISTHDGHKKGNKVHTSVWCYVYLGTMHFPHLYNESDSSCTKPKNKNKIHPTFCRTTFFPYSNILIYTRPPVLLRSY